jgi:DNA polymerase (family 10)
MRNQEIAKILTQISELLEMKEENSFKIAAYKKAAQIVSDWPVEIETFRTQDKIQELPGIGEGISREIFSLVRHKKSRRLESLSKHFPLELLDLLAIEGLGPRKLAFLYKKFKIKNVIQLERLLEGDYLLKYRGWGEKSKNNLKHAIKIYKKMEKRYLLGEIYGPAMNFLAELKKIQEINNAEICGSFRRAKETVGDLDVLISGHNPKRIIAGLTKLPEIEKIFFQGPTKLKIKLSFGPNSDIRVVKSESYGAALHYFTGSKNHNIKIRKMGQEQGLKINEYGIFLKVQKKFKKIGGEKENDVFKILGLPYIPPEIREDEGEIEAGLKNMLPRLIEPRQIKSDLHLHSLYSDGSNSIAQMAEAAKKSGLQYIAITDHASPLGVTNSLDQKKMNRQFAEIDRLNKTFNNFYILKGVEVDILKVGNLYLPDEVLAKFDIVLASVHSNFHLQRDCNMARLSKAMSNQNVDIIAHPTGRDLNGRPGYEIDFEALLKIAYQTKTILELNAAPSRLDLSGSYLHLAKQNKVKISVSTDSHSIAQLKNMIFGVKTAHKGWLEKNDIINSLPLTKIFEFLNKKKNLRKF